jgi:TrmH family RNA methyltransferase
MLVKSQVNYIQSLSQKKIREQEDVFVAEGPKIINELLGAGNTPLQHLYATTEWMELNRQLLTKLEPGKLVIVKESELARISFLSTPNQVLGVFAKPKFPFKFSLKGKLSLLLDTIQDPGNLGTIVRCADWFGVQQIVCTEDCADVFNPKTVQSTMGSISRVQVIYTDVLDLLEKNKNLPLYAAVLGGKDIHAYQKIKEGIVIIGNESKGIRSSLLALPVNKMTIPRKGGAESLNAAVAAGIILSHLT